MPAVTLEYETPHFLQSLLAHDQSLLRELGTALDLKVTSRDAWVKLDGTEAGITAGQRVFIQLEKARRGGAEINAHFFRFALDNEKSVLTSSEAQADSAAAGSLEDLTSIKLTGSPRRPPVIARTRTQLTYLQAIASYDVVFGIGPAGTGKTYLAMAAAVHALKTGAVNRIVLTRPAVEAGEALGFLPGDMNDKILPYLRPLYDALNDMLEPDEVERLIERGQIEIAPLAFMRGRTLSRSFIILDEAQNTTQAQMFMFLTRLGENSRAVITGDPSQIDLKDPRWSGLREAIQVLGGVEDSVRFVKFDGRDVVRHRVVRRIIEAYEHHRTASTPEIYRPGANVKS
ncbi:MAG: PhoH family protein [Verrucomicrobiales bacterium]|nr:PhoH family protein [Verrucomicrobiales bacterium]